MLLSMVKVALVGLGLMGKTHLDAYGKLRDVQVVAVCEPRADLAVQPGNAVRYADFHDMLRAGGFDVVDICVPTFLHAEYTISALEAGFHVFCEKPMALTVDETERMLAAVERSGKLFSVGQCLRYWPGYVEVKALIDSGRYGKVRYTEFARLNGVPAWSAGNWMGDHRLSGNAALDLHIHDVDMVMYLFGAPRAVCSQGVTEKDGSISQITTLYEYPDLAAQSSGGWIRSGSFDLRMRALYVLQDAAVELDSGKKPMVMVYPESGKAYPLALAEGDGYYHELKDFTDGVARGRLSGTVTGRSAADSVRLCLLEIESARDGERKRFSGG